MDKLIEALQIFHKYGNPPFPTHCEHDVLYICGYDQSEFSLADLEALDKLSFTWDDDTESFQSYLYGSA